jgi:hypothetical protein
LYFFERLPGNSYSGNNHLKVTVPVGANFAPVSVVNGERALIAYSSNNFNPTFTPTKGSITPKDFDA